MCSKTTLKKTAFVLLLVALISLIPSNTFRVFADDAIVPPFPYDELQTIGENDYVLFKVHGVDQVDYIECIAPKIRAPGAYEHLLPGLSYSGLGGWVLQINSIDYYFKDGKSIYFDFQSLFSTSYMPVENDDPYYSAWLEFVYASEDVFGIDEDSYSSRGVRFFKAQNFIIEPAATPTPTPETPEPTPELDNKFPTFINADGTVSYGSSRYINKYLICNRYYDEVNTRYEYQLFCVPYSQFNDIQGVWQYTYIPNYNGYDFINNVLTFYFPNTATYRNYDGKYGATFFTSANYKTVDDVYDMNHFISVGYTMEEPTERNYQFSITEPSMNYEATAVYLINLDGTTTRLDGQGGGTAATPTPTTAPTPIPQPSATPAPDDERPGWGWGIVSTLRYIFIPDKNKLIRLEKTASNRFQQFGGGYDDLKHVSGFEDPVRPQNIVMTWHSFSSSDEEQSEEQQQEITLVDFEQIDFYLFRTASGQFICECLSASFTFLMFGYLIHVIRKHFVIENSSSDDSNEGGD